MKRVHDIKVPRVGVWIKFICGVRDGIADGRAVVGVVTGYDDAGSVLLQDARGAAIFPPFDHAAGDRVVKISPHPILEGRARDTAPQLFVAREVFEVARRQLRVLKGLLAGVSAVLGLALAGLGFVLLR